MEALMRRAAFISVLITISMGMIWLSGCGDGSLDLLDEIGYTYIISYADVQDRGASTYDIDVIWGCDDDTSNDGTDGDGEDLLTKASMDLTFQSSSDVESEGYIYQIDITYTLIDWVSTTSVTNIPEIPDKSYLRTVVVPSGGSSTTESFDLLTPADKATYVANIGGADVAVGVAATFQVTVRAYLTFTPSSPNNDYELPPYSFTINVQNFTDSSCGSSDSSSSG